MVLTLTLPLEVVRRRLQVQVRAAVCAALCAALCSLLGMLGFGDVGLGLWARPLP